MRLRAEETAARERSEAAPKLLSAAVLDQIESRLRVIAKAKRIALLEALNEGEAGVQELADQVGLAHQNASHHLAILRDAGIITARREQNRTIYSISDWSAWWVVSQIAGSLASSGSHPDD